MHTSRVYHAPLHARALRLLNVFRCECVKESGRVCECVKESGRVCECVCSQTWYSVRFVVAGTSLSPYLY